MYDLDFLKEVLSIPTKTFEEHRMVEYITQWLKDNNIEYYVDTYLNVYATKKIDDNEPEYYPCVVSHTDTVHHIDTINVREETLKDSQGNLSLSLKAYNDAGYPVGIGGDDKCGVFACLTLLKELPYLKAAFFVSEEVGCIGSKNADPSFFKNVGYAIQFDAPEDYMVTEVCFGEVLFDRNSDFFKTCDQILKEGVGNHLEYMRHPYTDVYSLKKLFNFSCINISIGYYNMHRRDEYVVVKDTFNGVELGRRMIESLGYSNYEYEGDNLYNHNNKLRRYYSLWD